MIALRARDTLGYDGKAPGDLPRTAAKETRGRAPAYANASMNSRASSALLRSDLAGLSMADVCPGW